MIQMPIPKWYFGIIKLTKYRIMTTATLSEKRDKTKARNTSIIIHLLLLLIAFFYFWTMDIPKPPKTFNTPIVVDMNFKESSLSKYAHSDAGKKKAKTEAPKKIETKKTNKIEVKKPKVVIPEPKPTEPTPTDPIVSETTVDEAPVEAVEEEIEIEEPEPEVIPEVVEEEVVEEEVITEADLEELLEEELDGQETAAEESQESTTGDGGSDETDSSIEGDGGTGESSDGDGDGATSGDDGDEGVGDVGSGTGDYDGSGNGVFGRRIVKRNWRGLDLSRGVGIIVVKFCVDREGNVTFVELLETETTETDTKKLKQALTAMRGYKVQKDPNAPPEQCGKYVFKIDVNALQGN